MKKVVGNCGLYLNIKKMDTRTVHIEGEDFSKVHSFKYLVSPLQNNRV